MFPPPRSLALALIVGVVAAALTYAAYADCARRRIPNRANLLILLSGCAYQFMAGPAGLWLGLQGAVVGFMLLLPLYLYAGLGGGDVKLLAASGMLLGPLLILQAAVLTAFLGGAGALLTVAVSPQRGAVLRRWWGRVGRRQRCLAPVGGNDPGKRRMPVAPAAGVAVLVVILQSGGFARIFEVTATVGLITCTI